MSSSTNNIVEDELISPKPGLVLMMCGIVGSGKTTFAKKLEQEKGYIRLSIDEEIWSNFGRYGVDYKAEEYSQCQEMARHIVEQKLIALLRGEHKKDKKNVVLDLSFWCKAERDRVKALISEQGGESKIIYLKLPADVVRQRLKKRSSRFDANAAFPITDELFRRYSSGFEEPFGEGEIVIEQEEGESEVVVGL